MTDFFWLKYLLALSLQMWGIEFYDEAAKTRRSMKSVSPKTDETPSKNSELKGKDAEDAPQETGTEELVTESCSGLDSSLKRENASSDQIPQPNQSVVTSEQADLRPELAKETLEEKLSDHVRPTAAEDVELTEVVERRRHMTPNLRDESIEEEYVIITHKRNCESKDLPKPGMYRAHPGSGS